MDVLNQATLDCLQRAANALASVDEVPRSPGRMLGDRLLLCAGAALVVEAARGIITQDEAAELAREIIIRGTRHIIRKAKEFSLDPVLVRGSVLRNDACPDSERRQRMIEFFTEIGVRSRSPIQLFSRT
jgi:hypothetical protein